MPGIPSKTQGYQANRASGGLAELTGSSRCVAVEGLGTGEKGTARLADNGEISKFLVRGGVGIASDCCSQLAGQSFGGVPSFSSLVRGAADAPVAGVRQDGHAAGTLNVVCACPRLRTVPGTR